MHNQEEDEILLAVDDKPEVIIRPIFLDAPPADPAPDVSDVVIEDLKRKKELEAEKTRRALARSYTYEPLLQFFAFDHLPGMLQEISRPFHELAVRMVRGLPANSERKEMLRKLLESKDCAVRSFIYK